MALASVGDNPPPQLDNANIHKSDTDKKSAAASTEGNLNMKAIFFALQSAPRLRLAPSPPRFMQGVVGRGGNGSSGSLPGP